MLNTLKEYFEEISLLPKGVKIFFSTVILFAIGGAVYFGASNFIAGVKIERLEKQNFELNRTATTAQEKAARSEKAAADEAVRAESLENQLQALSQKEKITDEKITVQSQKSNNLRLDLDRVRNSQPANTSTEELERRLAERYGKTNGSRRLQ
jgi:hypothetical protein